MKRIIEKEKFVGVKIFGKGKDTLYWMLAKLRKKMCIQHLVMWVIKFFLLSSKIFLLTEWGSAVVQIFLEEHVGILTNNKHVYSTHGKRCRFTINLDKARKTQQPSMVTLERTWCPPGRLDLKSTAAFPLLYLALLFHLNRRPESEPSIYLFLSGSSSSHETCGHTTWYRRRSHVPTTRLSAAATNQPKF